ncbi:ABC transporter ATP-binding protein [Streptomyces sp. NPDC004288]
MAPRHLSGLLVEVRGLTKRFGSVTATEDLSFRVAPGAVTGFLGPNGSGKSTTLRMLLGLVTPTAGTATIGGLRYAELTRPTSQVGAALSVSAFHPAHTARDHLRIHCAMGGHPAVRVDTLIERLGLAPVADRRTRTYSTGTRQRLSLATALLGDPEVLLLDEPANGLDPQGIAWLRGLLRERAAEGRAVLVSSHVLSEVRQVADHVVMINRGRLVAAAPLGELERSAPGSVLVRSPDASALRGELLHRGRQAGVTVDAAADGWLRVRNLTDHAVADVAARAGLRVHGLMTRQGGLEEMYLRLTAEQRTKDAEAER